MPSLRVVTLTRKGEIIQGLIELSTWRKQLRYATKAKRYDLALRAVDNCFALTERCELAFEPSRSGPPFFPLCPPLSPALIVLSASGLFSDAVIP